MRGAHHLKSSWWFCISLRSKRGPPLKIISLYRKSISLHHVLSSGPHFYYISIHFAGILFLTILKICSFIVKLKPVNKPKHRFFGWNSIFRLQNKEAMPICLAWYLPTSVKGFNSVGSTWTTWTKSSPLNRFITCTCTFWFNRFASIFAKQSRSAIVQFTHLDILCFRKLASTMNGESAFFTTTTWKSHEN